MEWKIGEIRQIENNWYQCIKDTSCSKCDFLKTHCRNNPEIKCTVNGREDGESVIFKKLDRIIGPIIIKNRTFQKFASYSPSCTNCVFNDSNKICRKKDYIDDICDGNGFWVEIKENIERKIGEIFNYNGEWYQCLNELKCTKCDLRQNRRCIAQHNDIGFCSDYERTDHKSVIFKKLEKVGEPYNIGKKVFQRYEVFTKPYIFNEDFFTINTPVDDSFISIEIKQNEDMEETNANLSNSENIGKILKPFDLEAAKAGKPVCTRDGRKARIVCFDRTGKFPIVALVEAKDRDDIYSYLNCGKDNESVEKEYDLMMAPEIRHGWINIYPKGSAFTESIAETSYIVYPTKELAIRNSLRRCIATISIEWEE